ncbi:Vacuolar protein sorting-associated protein 51-like protein [Trichoplax sp. H2]|nr:Vacuolar protein sorting-associated protein 51-like protein [Trichoplax sp. H2]|eukprot:RDD38593.1 Vacuolar protein sorting-associated protein 51-like protein [Trichoplax sp. H2]
MAASDFDGGDEPTRRPTRGILKLYYGLQEQGGSQTIDPLDIDSNQFKVESYLSKQLRENGLQQLMEKETEMVKQIRALDSEMQTLVYENYNKFISATDTIKKMKHDFKKMENEMEQLAIKMSSITEFSSNISSTLAERRQQITKLSGVHTLLKKLQFLFELPFRLKQCIHMKSFSQAVRYYTKTRDILDRYHHEPSFQGIRNDCQSIMGELCKILKEKFDDPESTSKELTTCVELLLQLKEKPDELYDKFLNHAKRRLDEDLQFLRQQLQSRKLNMHTVSVDGEQNPNFVTETSAITTSDDLLNADVCRKSYSPNANPANIQSMDILEFIDCGCNGFVSDMCLVIATYKENFMQYHGDIGTPLQRETENAATERLRQFVQKMFNDYLSYCQDFILLEIPCTDSEDNPILVRALDRFYRRLQALDKLLPDIGIKEISLNVVFDATRERLHHYLKQLKAYFADCITDIRQTMASNKISQKDKELEIKMIDLLHRTISAVTQKMKYFLDHLEEFINPDFTTIANTAYFRNNFCRDVRDSFVINFIKHVNIVAKNFCTTIHGKGMSIPPELLLLLSRLCSDFHNSTINYIISITDEKFPHIIGGDSSSNSLSVMELRQQTKDTAQTLLDYYVKTQGLIISQMIRKSVETRDWMNTIEPRNVRSVMKRVVEDLNAVDVQVGMLFEDASRHDIGSDSGRRPPSRNQSKQWGYSGNVAPFDTSLMSNIQKLFTERIEIFSAVEFSKLSVMTGIVKIALKTFLECIRLRTFNKYGLQQIQVDTYYLYLHLWKFVSDESIVSFLLDEVVNSTVNRCLEPLLMEQSIVEVICDAN